MQLKHKTLVTLYCAIGGVVSSGLGAAFTPGDIVVFQAGDGSGPVANGDAYACSLLEFNPAAINQSSPVQTISLPTIDSGTQHAFTTAGQVTDHLMTLSADGRYLSVMGFDVPAGGEYLDPVLGREFAYTSPNRTIARINALGNVDTSTAGPFGVPNTSTRGTASLDGSGFWYTAGPVSSATPSLGYVAYGSNTPSILSSNYSGREVSIYNDQLYGCSSAGGISQIGIGLPVAGTPALIPLPDTNNTSVNQSPVSFFLATVRPTDTSADLLYLCNGNSSGYLNKYIFSNGKWTLSGQLSDPNATGLTGEVNNGVVTLFITSIVNGSAVLSSVTDTSGYNSLPTGTKLTTLYSVDSRSNTLGFRGVALVPTGGTSGVSAVWNSQAGGNWSTSANWIGGVPNAMNASATFGNVINSSCLVVVDAPETIGSLIFSSPQGYTVGGASAITFASGAGTPAINVVAGSHLITAPLVASGGINITTAADPGGGEPSLTLPLAVTATGTITKAGSGTLAFAASAAGISLLTLPNLAITAGTVAVDTGSSSGNRTLLTLDSLTIAGGHLDLCGNDLDIKNGSLGVINSLVAVGNNSVISGIGSSTAAEDPSHLMTLGAIQNSIDGTPTGAALFGTNNTSLGLYDGTNPQASDVLVKYTYFGDSNLDGRVDGSDYSRIDSGYLNGLTGWYNGDFNYDGSIDGSDYTLIDNAFNTQGARQTSNIVNPVAQETARISGAAVPEPVSFVPLLIAAGRIRRHRVSRTLNAKLPD